MTLSKDDMDLFLSVPHAYQTAIEQFPELGDDQQREQLDAVIERLTEHGELAGRSDEFLAGAAWTVVKSMEWDNAVLQESGEHSHVAHMLFKVAVTMALTPHVLRTAGEMEEWKWQS